MNENVAAYLASESFKNTQRHIDNEIAGLRNADITEQIAAMIKGIELAIAAAVRAERVACARDVCTRCRDGESLWRGCFLVFHGASGCVAENIWQRDWLETPGQAKAEWLASVNALLAERAK